MAIFFEISIFEIFSPIFEKSKIPHFLPPKSISFKKTRFWPEIPRGGKRVRRKSGSKTLFLTLFGINPEGERESPKKFESKKSRFCQSLYVFWPCFFSRFLLFFRTVEKMAFLGPKRGNGFSIFLEMFFSELKNSNLFFLRLDFLQKYRKNDDFDLKREKSKTRFLGSWKSRKNPLFWRFLSFSRTFWPWQKMIIFWKIEFFLKNERVFGSKNGPKMTLFCDFSKIRSKNRPRKEPNKKMVLKDFKMVQKWPFFDPFLTPFFQENTEKFPKKSVIFTN